MRTVQVQKVYLAGNTEDHEQFRKYAAEIPKPVFTVVSTWFADSRVSEALAQWRGKLKAESDAKLNLLADIVTQQAVEKVRLPKEVRLPSEYTKALNKCIKELDSADIVIAFLDGGSFEAGYALARGGKHLILIGDLKSPLAYPLSDKVKIVEDWIRALAILKRLEFKQVFGAPPLRSFIKGAGK
jgi:hypothetical protein